MNVDFLHNQIIRDTITPAFIESFNENLLPSLCLKYGESLEYVQFYEDHLKDGLRIGGIFYYPLTLVISGVAKTEWISWQVSNYRLYDNFNPFTYKGQEFLAFSLAQNVPAEALSKVEGKPIYSRGNTLPVILSAATDDKTFLAGKYAQGFIDLLSSELTEAIENEIAIVGLASSGVILEMNFAPGTYMEHIVGNTTYRRLRIKARACSARDLWVKWTRLDGNGTYTISDNVDRSMIKFELAEDVPGKIKEKEYRYLTTESVNKYQQSMGRKNITEWREMMRRVIRRGEVEKYERIKIAKPATEPVPEKVEDEPVPVAEPVAPVVKEVSAVKIPAASVERDRDEITERLNALLGKPDVEFAREPEALAESINSDLSDLLRGALGISADEVDEDDAAEEAIEDAIKEIEDEDAAFAAELPDEDGDEDEDESDEALDEEPDYDIADDSDTDNTVKEASIASEPAPAIPVVDESELEARIRRELEEKMRAEMEELRRKNEEAEALRAKLEAQRRAEAREKELLAEAARQAILDSEKREADRRAEAERDRIEAERKAEAAKRAEEERRRAEEARAEQERIDAEMQAKRAEEAKAPAAEEAKPVYVSKTVNLIFRRGGVDKAMTKRVHEIILATIKYLGKENVYMRIKASVPDPTTLTLTFSEIPASEQQLIVDIIQVLGKSNLGITKATLD